jgi:hypothetical protein
VSTLIATTDGLHVLGDGTHHFHGQPVEALSRGTNRSLFIVGGDSVAWRDDDGVVSEQVPIEAPVNCALEHGRAVLIGATGARLFEHAGGVTVLREDFQTAPGRERWHTPWGGPPDVRSMALDADGATIYVNVHVGGVLRWRPDDPVWRPTMDINADVHQVIAHPTRPGTALAAAAWGLGVSLDHGDSWEWRTGGLHGDYCRAVTVWEDTVLVSASLGSRGREAAVYEGTLAGDVLTRCTPGLPEWFSTNVNTHCLALDGNRALIGDADGTLFESTDGGSSWRIAGAFAPIRAVALS